ncbi:hypothetical protein U2I57_05550 [Bacillus cereus]|uniref:hypothetical protein n=1 Tax=Bacillus cereus TaxID=1396 RepID=UPI0032DE4F72
MARISKGIQDLSGKRLPVVSKQELRAKKEQTKGVGLLPSELRVNVREKHNEQLKFSFVYFDRQNSLFNCGGTQNGWFISLVDHLKEVSNLTKNEFLFTQQYKNHYKAHQHNWDKLSHRYPMSDILFEQVKDDCWQFRLSKSTGRIHGFIIGNIFYVVWLDPHHNFHPDEKFGGEKQFKVPETPYEILSYEREQIAQQFENLREEHKLLQDMAEEIEEENKELKKKLGVS